MNASTFAQSLDPNVNKSTSTSTYTVNVHVHIFECLSGEI